MIWDCRALLGRSLNRQKGANHVSSASFTVQVSSARRSRRVAVAALAFGIAGTAVAQAQGTAQAPAAPPPPLPETGVWIDDTGKGAVEITPCGTKLCGNIVWLQEPLSPKGKQLTDDLNPDKSQRSQPICGLQVIGNLVQQKDGSWDAGWVYDPKTGDRFDLTIKLKAADKLAVTGYAGIKLLSETFTWTRAPANPPLPRCSTIKATVR